MGQFYFFRFSKERGTDGYFNHINYNSMLTIRFSILMGFEFIEDYAVDLHKKRNDLEQRIGQRILVMITKHLIS